MSKMLHNSLSDLPIGSRIYFVGIAGISMCGLAEIAVHLKYVVAGSDPRSSLQVLNLRDMGVIVNSEQKGENIDAFMPELVIYSQAIPQDNPELQRARELGIQTINRARFLGWITRAYKSVINIAGTHGKTTTTAMCSMILIESGANPTVHLGADLDEFNESTVHLGSSNNLLVSEACEYKNSLLNFYSTTAAILNIDEDHMDFFHDIDDIIKTFVRFGADLPEEGNLVIPYHSRHIGVFMDRLRKLRLEEGHKMPNIVTFGPYMEDSASQPTFYYKDLTYENGLSRFSVYFNNELYRHIKLSVPGEHNVRNCLAAIACAHYNGGTPEAAARVLADFKGAGGRFTHVGTYKGAQVIADYAHHPTEIAATLEAASNIPHRKIWPVCQILNYTRAKDLYENFIEVFKDYEEVIFYKIYSTREKDNLGMSAERFVDDINSRGRKAYVANTPEELLALLSERTEKDDLLLFLGPEEIREVSHEICKSKDGVYLHH